MSDNQMRGGGGLGNELQELEDMDGGNSMGDDNPYIQASGQKDRKNTLDQLNQSYTSDTPQSPLKQNSQVFDSVLPSTVITTSKVDTADADTQTDEK